MLAPEQGGSAITFLTSVLRLQALRRLTWIDVLPEALGGAAVLAAGLFEAVHTHVAGAANAATPVAAVLCAVAVGLARSLPSAALGLSVVAGVLHLGPDVPVLVVEATYCVVMFGAARWGRPVTSVAALAILVVGAGAALALLDRRSVASVSVYLPIPVVETLTRSGRAWQVAAAATVAVLLVVPWLIGLVLRLLAGAVAAREGQRAAQAEAERAHREVEQAQRIALLEEDRTRLAHDVHDVVGHSLAVILTQAESGQYAADVETLKRTMATIATSARSSLQDVRHVLEAGQGRSGPLGELVAGVRASGHDVDETVTGMPRPLPPELEAVAYRVLQEMLTNALRHGRRDGALRILQEWGDRLTLQVSNASDGGPIADGGHGLEGMRRRLVAIGGHLDVQPGEEFTVTATMPVRAEQG